MPGNNGRKLYKGQCFYDFYVKDSMQCTYWNYTLYLFYHVLSKIPRHIIRQMAHEHLEKKWQMQEPLLSSLRINYTKLIKLYRHSESAWQWGI